MSATVVSAAIAGSTALVDQTVKPRRLRLRSRYHFPTNRPAVDFPLLTTPVTTGFIAELADLPLSNADTNHVTATAFKIAGATQVSSEMLADLDPDIAAQIGASIADQVIWSLDTAVLGTTTANGPSGLLSLASTQVDPGTSLTNLDPFIKAVYAARNATVNANVTHFVVSPATAQALSLLKIGSATTSRSCSSKKTALCWSPEFRSWCRRWSITSLRLGLSTPASHGWFSGRVLRSLKPMSRRTTRGSFLVSHLTAGSTSPRPP